MADILLGTVSLLALVALLGGAYRRATWFPSLRNVLVRGFGFVAFLIATYKIDFIVVNVRQLATALTTSPSAPLSASASYVRELARLVDLMNLGLLATVVVVAVGASLRPVAERMRSSTSAA
jgi:hypothetical protein